MTDQKILIAESASPQPEISIILPTYRRCQNGMLERSIRSVLAQTYTDFELLVMDDGSTDGSYDLIEAFRAKDPRLVHVRHERNSGIHSVRLNEGIEMARGKYIAFQFDDDAWLPNALQDLHEEISRYSEPVLVLGHSHFRGPTGEWTLPRVDINLVTMYETNRFANNAVLFPRHMVDTYGMYDCHLGMRRLCDWDLWLRLIKHIPFVVIDSVVSRVYESNPGSLGLTVPYDIPLFYYLHSIPRDHLLTPSRWRDYPVDSLQIAGVELEKDFRRRVYEEQIAPYQARFRHYFPGVEGFSAALSRTPQKTVLITKQSYDTCNDVTLNNYDEITNQRGSFKSYFLPLQQVRPNWRDEVDLLLLLRTVEDTARLMVHDAVASGIPVGCYLDDDLLTFHEYGPQFDYLAPGTPFHSNLTEIIRAADGVLVTNHFIAESVRPLNSRLIPHNNSVPSSYLPVDLRQRKDAPIRIGYAGQGYRIEEFRHIWDGLVKISEKYGDQVEFDFWGLDVSALPALKSPVHQRPFTFSYFAYLEALKSAEFDIMITPMLDRPRPRLGKSLIKYYETAVAGALGIFSDVPQYEALPAGLTCFKVKNTAEDWADALGRAIEMPLDEFDRMRLRCIAHVKEEYTAEAQVHYHEAALRAVEFHARTRALRKEDGRPRVMYVLHSAYFGGAEIQLFRRLHLARDYGIEPIVVLPKAHENTPQAAQMKALLEGEGLQVEFVEYACFTEPRSPDEYFSEIQREQVRELLQRCRPALVHTVTFIPSFGQICSELDIPHISTQYAIEDGFSWSGTPPAFSHCDIVQSDTFRYASRWSELLGDCPKFIARDMAPLEAFQHGQQAYLASVGEPLPDWPPSPLRLVVTGTFQARKQQLQTIEAVGKLVKQGIDCRLDFYGYTHYFPEYMDQCHQAIQEWGLEERVAIHDFNSDIASVLGRADVLLSLSTFESFPGAIKDAMAAGLLVVATPVGGVTELISDGISGIVCKDTSVEAMVAGIHRAIGLSPAEKQRIVEQARRIARFELHLYRAADDLFEMYNLAIEFNQCKPGVARPQPTPPAAAPHPRLADQVQNPPDPPQSTQQVGNGLVYSFIPGRQNWIGLDVMVGTHLRRASGQLSLTVRSPRGGMMRQVSIDLATVRDNEWVALRFPPIKNSSGKRFTLEFELANPGADTLVSLYQTSPIARNELRALRRLSRSLGLRMQGAGLYCREWYG